MGLLARRVMDRLGVTPIHEVGVRRKIPVPMPRRRDAVGQSLRTGGAREDSDRAGEVALRAGSVRSLHRRPNRVAGLPRAPPELPGHLWVRWRVTYGGSYLGYTQWAIAAAAGPELKAMAMQVTMSDFSQMTYAGDSLMLENAATWTKFVSKQLSRTGMASILLQRVTKRPAISDLQFRSLPLATVDEVTTGERVPFWRDWMAHDSAADPWWQSMNFHKTIPEVGSPITFVAGWHDIFAPWSLDDFETLQQAGARVRITVGPLCHTDQRSADIVMQEALDWFAVHLGNQPDPGDPPVKLFVQKADEWRQAPPCRPTKS